MADSDDEPMTLSSHALDALKEFYTERDEKTKKFEELKAAAQERLDATTEAEAAAAREAKLTYPLSMALFGEDWNESQFWYSDKMATSLARVLLDGATAETRIAVVSTPSVFVALKNILASQPPETPKPHLTLLEHDERFALFSEFVFYDFGQPVKLPASFKGTFDRFIIDPPFLNENCQTKMALTVRWLAKTPAADAKVILVTGERMKDLVLRLYKAFELRPTDKEVELPTGLSNEFYCYTSFECDEWKWRTEA